MKFGSWQKVIVGCVSVTLMLAGVKFWQIKKAIEFGQSFGEPSETVELAIAEPSSWQPTVSVNADVLAIKAVDISNELGGRVIELGFKPGDSVKKGQLLVAMDTSEERAQLAAAKADAELARLALERNQKLAKKGVASQEQRDQALAQSSAAIASEDRLKAIIAKKTIRAPFDGVAGIFELQVGQYLQANTLLTRLIGETEQVWVDFYLAQQQAYLNVGDTVSVASAKFLDEPLTAKVIARDSWINPRSGNLRYRAIVDNSAGRLYPGSVVTVKAAVGEPQQVIRLPVSAIRYDAFGANVYVLEPAEQGAGAPERAVKRSVELGPEQDLFVIVTKGVKPGERIAGNGAFKLRSGLLVNAVESVPASSQAVANDRADEKPAVENPDASSGTPPVAPPADQPALKAKVPGLENAQAFNAAMVGE